MPKSQPTITFSASRDIPFNQLVLSQANVRRVKALRSPRWGLSQNPTPNQIMMPCRTPMGGTNVPRTASAT